MVRKRPRVQFSSLAHEKDLFHSDLGEIWLPHDGDTQDKVHDVSYESAMKAAGYGVTVVPNQGKGAAKARVEEARRLFPSMRFHQETTQAGLDALGWYHEKQDENRNIGLGPEHDWSSHGADAFGLMCVAYEEPRIKAAPKPRVAAGGWMGRWWRLSAIKSFLERCA